MPLLAHLRPPRHCGACVIALALLSAATLFSQDRPVLNHPTEDKPVLNRPAENPPDQAVKTISVEVKVVNVLATVRDKHGAPLTNLTKEDFAVEEDGRPQVIKYFALEKDLPLTLGVMVDTSMSQRAANQQERSASATFFDKVLREKDRAFLLHFDREVELLQDLTSSRQKLRDAVADLQTSRPSRDYPDDNGSGGQQGGGNSGGGRGGYGGQRDHAGTLLYDAIFLSSDELMKKQQGRKALIILSDGVDHGSKLYLDKAIESAQRSDTVVYTIYYPGEEPKRSGFGNGDDRDRGGMGRRGGMGGPGIGMPPMGGGGGGGQRGGGGRPREDSKEVKADGKRVLERIAHETGGKMFEVSKKHTVEQAFDEIQEDLRSQYFLGYTPDRPGTLGDYRKIHLTTKQSETTVQARDGYYVAQ